MTRRNRRPPADTFPHTGASPPGRVVPGPGRIRRRDLLARQLHAQLDTMLAGLEAAADCAEASRSLQEEALSPADRLARFAGILESLASGLLRECDELYLTACREQRFRPEETEDIKTDLRERVIGYFCMLLKAHGGNVLEGLDQDEAARLLAQAQEHLLATLANPPSS